MFCNWQFFFHPVVFHCCAQYMQLCWVGYAFSRKKQMRKWNLLVPVSQLVNHKSHTYTQLQPTICICNSQGLKFFIHHSSLMCASLLLLLIVCLAACFNSFAPHSLFLLWNSPVYIYWMRWPIFAFFLFYICSVCFLDFFLF